MFVYITHRLDRDHPYAADGKPHVLILPHTISLGILIREGLALLPGNEWHQPTLGL